MGPQEVHRFCIDVLELGVAVDVLLSRFGLAVRLQTITQIVQKLKNERTRHVMSAPGQFTCKVAYTARCPQ